MKNLKLIFISTVAVTVTLGAILILVIYLNATNADKKESSAEEVASVNIEISEAPTEPTETPDEATPTAAPTEVPSEKTASPTPTKKTEAKATEVAKATEKATEKAEITEAAKAAEPVAALPAGSTPVAVHGALKVSGSHLTDKNGNNFQIKGVSTHGLAWFPGYVNKESFKTLRDEWGANCVRLAMYTTEYGGYCEGGADKMKGIVDNGVSAATELGMYVIIDWHVLQDKDPNVHAKEAVAFFSEVSKKYAANSNVIYEICNEPNGDVGWGSIKAYAEQVIPVIKANDPDAIIIVGTPTWSQEVDKAAADPITGYSNIMYTLHFYAGTHKDSLRNTLQGAVNKGLPVFVTEFGTCDASGSGGNDFASADAWISLLDKNGISYCIWSLCNKAETSALINSSCDKTAGWSEADLSEAGKWYVKKLGNNVKPGSLNIGGPAGNKADGAGKEKNDPKPGPAHDAVKADSGNTSITLSESNGWNDGSKDYHQIDIIVKNKGDKEIKNWKTVIDFGKDVEIDQSWNGKFNVSGSKVTVTPADFNKNVPAGGTVDAGLIIKCSGPVKPSVTVE